MSSIFYSAFFIRTFEKGQFLRQVVAEIRWEQNLILLNNKPVGISGYVTRLTESLPKKLKGLLPSPEEIEAELSRKDWGNSGG